MIKALVIAWILWSIVLLIHLFGEWGVLWGVPLLAAVIAAVYGSFFWNPSTSAEWPLNAYELAGIVACLALRGMAIYWWVRMCDRLNRSYEEERRAHRRFDLQNYEIMVRPDQATLTAAWGNTDLFFWPGIAVWIIPKLSLVALPIFSLVIRGNLAGCIVLLAAWFILDFLWRTAHVGYHLRYAIVWSTEWGPVWNGRDWGEPVLFLIGEALVPILLWLSILLPHVAERLT